MEGRKKQQLQKKKTLTENPKTNTRKTLEWVTQENHIKNGTLKSHFSVIVLNIN